MTRTSHACAGFPHTCASSPPAHCCERSAGSVRSGTLSSLPHASTGSTAASLQITTTPLPPHDISCAFHETVRSPDNDTPLFHLRQKVLDGTISMAQYTLRAAATYCRRGMPLRARSLLRHYADLGCNIHALRYRVLQGHVHALLRRMRVHSGLSCMLIMRDAADVCMDALESIDTCADEIVICDTGSTDDSITRAALFGARLRRITWHDDFAAARNSALAMCTCGWVLWLDADDRLLPGSVTALRTVVTRDIPPRAYACRVRNTNGSDISGEFLQIRLFAHHPAIRFHYRVHEQLTPSLKKAAIEIRIRHDIVLSHHGYTDESTHRAKAQRNLALVHRQLQDTPENLHFRCALAECHHTLGNLRAAAQQYRCICDAFRGERVNTEVTAVSAARLARILIQSGSLDTAEKLLHWSLRLMPRRSDTLFSLGVLMLRRGRDNEALSLLSAAVRATQHCSFFAVNTAAIRYHGLTHIAEILVRVGRIADAGRILNEALMLFPDDPVLTRLCKKCSA